jgi:hypothetical protein
MVNIKEALSMVNIKEALSNSEFSNPEFFWIFSKYIVGGFPHLGDFEGYDRKNRGADLLVHQFLMNSLIYITRIHHQYQKLCLWQSKST